MLLYTFVTDSTDILQFLISVVFLLRYIDLYLII